MTAKRATFIVSASAPSGFPAADLPEIAFAGRSNVGKSSLINTLVGVKGLARTSRTPGRTRLLNWFRVTLPKSGKPLAFVDLPGYGYAKVSRSMRETWRPLVESYLEARKVLRGVVLIVDLRRGVQEEERGLYAWLEGADIPAIVVLTKADKLSKSKRKPAALAVKRELGLRSQPVLFSALTQEGLTDLWGAIARQV